MTKGSDWCEERTIVDRVGEQSDWESEYVFMNDCGTPMTLTWAANRELLISYSYATTGKAHVYRKAYSNDGKVTINYSLEPEWLQ